MNNTIEKNFTDLRNELKKSNGSVLFETIKNSLNQLLEEIVLTGGKSNLQDLFFVTGKEFSRKSFSITIHNYSLYVDNLKVSEVIEMLNILSLCRGED